MKGLTIGENVDMMYKLIKNVKFLKNNLVEQHKLSKIIMPLSIINAILFEGKVIVGVFLPSFMLRIASGIYTIEQSVFFAAFITAAIPLLSLLQNIVNQKINNEQEKLFNIRIGKFDEQLYGLSLETAESNECLEFEEEALMGVYQTQNVVFEIFSVLLGRIITIITTSIIFINVHFMLVVFVVLTLLVIFALDEKAVKVEQLHNKAISKKRHIRGYISEIMFSIDYGAEERLYNIKDFLISKYNNNEKNIRTLENKRSFSKMKYQASLAFMNALQTIGIYGFAIWQFSSDNIQLYDFLIYISAALMMSGAIRQVFNSYTTLSTMALYYEATERYMALPVCGSLDGHDPMPTHITDIIFENVSFTYPNQISPAVDNLSFRFSGNDIVAIVGENGAGKSTIIKLLLRLYKIDSGRILLNGKSIYSYDWNEYCRFFASAFQDYNMYALTLKENLLFGNCCKNTEMFLEQIGMLNKINNLPNKLETPYTHEFSSEGIQFSGGEEQRLIIARALCKESSCILTMDEPTASLDPLAERNLNHLTYEVRKDKLTLFVSHRFSTTRFCTKIIVLDNGKLVESGTHNDLMALDGLYAKMYNMQIAYYHHEDKRI